MIYIGKIEKDNFRMITEKIVTDEVVLTNRQIEHIKERHQNDVINYFKYLKDIVEKPDYIIKDAHPNTAFIIKQFKDEGKYFQLILRLCSELENIDYKNSIITFLKISQRKYNQYIRNKEIVWKNIDKEE